MERIMTQTLKPLTVTIAEALRITGIGRTKCYQLISQGIIKTTTIGRRRLVEYHSLECLVDAQNQRGAK